ncbi:MAG: hypothetical protein K9G48_13120, partial [Reyranella sp.]|nr:hypothetical protein [Reyranella sp.]
MRARVQGLGAMIKAHRWRSIVVGFPLMFCASLFGGYWAAGWLDSIDRDRMARDTLEEMKRGAPVDPVTGPEPKYARIDDIPDLPKYTEVEPGKPRPTFEEKPRLAGKPPQVAAVVVQGDQAWRRNALPFRDLNGKPLVAIVIDDVG